MATVAPVRRSRPRRAAALAPLALSLAVLPHLRGGLTPESADWTARLLRDHLGLDAAAVVDIETVLAFVGVGADHHRPGEPIQTELTRRALALGRPATGAGRRAVGCPRPGCPLAAALVLPLQVRGCTVGALKLYRARAGRMPTFAARAAEGLARLFGVYLELAELDMRAARVAQAELEALRAQISPHFLFNILTTIAALTRCQPAAAHDLLIDFADFFRETLAEHGEFVTLEDDLAYVERYLEFERVRLGDRLRVRYAIEPAARQAMVPVLVIQPLVENAVLHGLEARPGPGEVVVAACRKDDGWLISVSDDGVGIPSERQAQVLKRGYGTGLGMGLANVDQRLKSLFGPRSGLRLESPPTGGTRVSFWAPAGPPGNGVE